MLPNEALEPLLALLLLVRPVLGSNIVSFPLALDGNSLPHFINHVAQTIADSLDLELGDGQISANCNMWAWMEVQVNDGHCSSPLIGSCADMCAGWHSP
jgi:hypothetical protein